MRNLIQFIWRYHLVLMFLLAEFVSVGILIQYNSFHRANFLGYANEISGGTFKMMNEMTEYLELKNVNEKLAAENSRLRSKQKDSFFSLRPGIVFFNDSAHMQQYEYLHAKVINSTVGKRNNYLTINAGSDFSIEPQMGVISEDGVVGIVKATSNNYSSIISLLHKDFKVSARLKDNDYFGILTWDGTHPQYAQLGDIPIHVTIQVGDTLVTRGSGTVFPPDVLIGTIAEFEKIKGTDFYDIEVKLSVDFNKPNYVYIVRNKMKLEQQLLETETQTTADD